MNTIKEKWEKKKELLSWYECYLRLFRLLKNNEDKKKLNTAWQGIKKGLEKIYQ